MNHPLDSHQVENELVNSSALTPFFRHLDSLVADRNKVVSIVHIGDSHIQADFLSGTVRRNFQNNFGNAGRGLVFPYMLARTSGAIDMRFKYTGFWNHSSIMKGFEERSIGLCGYSVSANRNSSLFIDAISKTDVVSSFNKITVLTDSQSGGFTLEDSSLNYSLIKDGYNEVFQFPKLHDSLRLISSKVESSTIQGLVFENGNGGVLYHASGVNGSSTNQYLRSSTFEQQTAELNANLVIISFGTNDCYMSTSQFCAGCVKERYRSIISRMRSKNPGISILLTSPPDHYYRRRYSNRNIATLERVLHELAFEENVAVWSLYSIMGGSGSIRTWQRDALARQDLIHFTKEGYAKQGQLLFDAIMYNYQER